MLYHIILIILIILAVVSLCFEIISIVYTTKAEKELDLAIEAMKRAAKTDDE